MGVPSIFLRTFGCNFKCEGFGQPKSVQPGHPIQPRLTATDVAISHSIKPYKTYGDLPLLPVGCDSYASWHPAFKDLSPMLTIDQIAAQTKALLPNGEWGSVHLVITGGEPLLGWQKQYPELLSHEFFKDLNHITFETNGTQELSEELENYLTEWKYAGKNGSGRTLTFSVSPKLSLSWESRDAAIKPDVVHGYQGTGHTYLKFVITSEEDAAEALEITKQYQAAHFRGNVYLMPVGGTDEVYTLNSKAVALLALKHGLRYSDRLQVPLFKNSWGT